jgi:hypothetical protein
MIFVDIIRRLWGSRAEGSCRCCSRWKGGIRRRRTGSGLRGAFCQRQYLALIWEGLRSQSQRREMLGALAEHLVSLQTTKEMLLL